MTDATGTIAWAADYLPFGQADVTMASVENNLRFAGQYYDNETGLHYNYFRYYDPQLGRYLRADPKGVMKGFNHLYAYAKNNPLKYLDAFGLECKLIYDNKSLLNSDSKDEVVYGKEWHYDGFIQPIPRMAPCWCKFWRTKTTFEIKTEEYLIFKVWKCEEEVCGEKKVTYKTDIHNSIEKSKSFKDYIRDYTSMTGTMIVNDGYSIKGGNACSCPAPIP